MKTTVYQGEAAWSRLAYLKLVDDKVVFDCSNEEYGPIEFDIEILTEALSKHYYAKPLITQDEYNRRRDKMANEYQEKINQNNMGQQHVPLKIDENGNVIAVGSINDDNFDECVMCGKKSPYTRSTHIDFRVGYVEGGGQGCFQPHMCSQERSRKLFTISEELVYSTPNDAELGAKVRQMCWENIKK